jgi:hypothetical protein
MMGEEREERGEERGATVGGRTEVEERGSVGVIVR